MNIVYIYIYNNLIKSFVQEFVKIKAELTSHLKQSGWKSFPSALSLGTVFSPGFGAIGFLQ